MRYWRRSGKTFATCDSQPSSNERVKAADLPSGHARIFGAAAGTSSDVWQPPAKTAAVHPIIKNTIRLMGANCTQKRNGSQRPRAARALGPAAVLRVVRSV